MFKSDKAPLQFFVFTLFLLSSQFINPVRGEGGNGEGGINLKEIGYDYKEGSPKGPDHWGELKGEWKECKDGNSQSPIDLSDSNARKAIPGADDITVSYKPSSAKMTREDYDLSIEFEGDAGSIQINGTDYFLKKCHWHRFSEHFINGKSYDLELHMVHKSQDNKVAVVGFVYQRGDPDPFLSKISKNVDSLKSGTKEADLGETDPSSIKSLSSRFYRYIGSLTTPPCSGEVIWTVDVEVHSVSTAQLRLLEEADHGMNARPLQPLNNREITLFGA